MFISSDMGHSAVKLFDGNRIISFPAVVGDTQGDLMGRNNRMKIETNEGAWFVGETALKQSSTRIMGRSETWALSPEYRALLLYGLSEYTSSETGSVVVDLVTGLPIVDYKRNRASFIASLEQTHEIKRPGRRALSMTIRYVRPLPQGFAAARPYLATDRTVATLDLGSRNVNYATFAGAELIENKTDSAEFGATVVVNDIAKKIEENTRRELNTLDVIKVIKTGKVRAFNKTYDVSELINERTGYYARAIDALMARVWGNLAEIDTFAIFGGGALLIGEHIKEQFPDQAVIVNDPIFATVRAQYDFGKRSL